MSRARSIAAAIGLPVLSLLVALALAEAGVRAFVASGGPLARQLRAWDPYAVKVEPHGAFGYRPRAAALFPYPNGTRATENARGWRGPVVALPKPAGTIRIILLGESTTHGWGVNDSETIDTYLREDLVGRLPGVRVEVVNLAFDGYDAYQIWQRLRSDGVRLEPDAIVLNTGVNDVRNARYPALRDPDPRTLIWEGEMRRLRAEAERGGPALKTRIKHFLFLARLPGVLRQRSSTDIAAGPQPAETVYPDAAANFARNVERIADEAARLGVPLLLSTPPSVLTRPGGPARMEPRGYWIVGPAETQAYRDTLAARLVTIAGARASGAGAVRYVGHDLAPDLFLDDCHLTPAGNRLMAADFAAALAPLFAPVSAERRVRRR